MLAWTPSRQGESQSPGFNEIPIAHQISWDTRHGGVRLVHLSDEFVIGRGFVHETPTLAIDGDHTELGAIPPQMRIMNCSTIGFVTDRHKNGRASCRARVCQYV